MDARCQLPNRVQDHSQRRALRLLASSQGNSKSPVGPDAQLPELWGAQQDVRWADAIVSEEPCQQPRCPAFGLARISEAAYSNQP